MIGNLVKRAGSSLLNHPRMVMGGAAAVGVFAAHPLRPASQAYQEEMFGDKSAIWTAVKDQAQVEMADMFTTPSQKRQIASLSRPDDSAAFQNFTSDQKEQYSRDTNPYLHPSYATNTARNTMIDGNIVFGLYNNRLGGS